MTTKAVVSDRIDHSSAIAQYASMKNIDTVRAGKLFRSRLRANFAVVCEKDPANYGPEGTFKVGANDKRPWGSHNVDTLRALKLAPQVK
jgi:hypothetical protein